MTTSSLKYPNLTIDWNSFHQFIRKQQLAKSIFMTIKKCSCVFLSHVLVQKTKFWHSIPLLQKPFYWSLFIPLIVPNKNRFSSVCSLPRSSALLPSYMQAGIHGSSVRFAQASVRSDRLHTARLGTLTASGLNGSVRLYTINYKQKMALHLLLRTETFMFLHKYFHCIGIVKVMFNPLKTMWQLLTQKSKNTFVQFI